MPTPGGAPALRQQRKENREKLLGKRLKIDDLLATAVQPFDDIPETMLKSMSSFIGKKLATPVTLTSDGILINGSQRLKAMKRKRRKEIGPEEYAVLEEADASNAEEWSHRLNFMGREYSVEVKAKEARYWQDTKKWSQARIARDIFGVSPAAVSQWLAGQPKPASVVGSNGVVQPVGTKKGGGSAGGRPPSDPWVNPTGTMPRAINGMMVKLYDRANLPHEFVLGPAGFAEALGLLRDLRDSVNDVILMAEATVAPKRPRTPTKRPAKKAAPAVK